MQSALDALRDADRYRIFDHLEGGSALELLGRWREFASILAAHDDPDPGPRWSLYEEALDWWIEAGGRIRKSRAGPESVNAGAIGGPTVRYLQAAVGPVIGARAPSAEGLRKILDRYAAELEKLVAHDDEMAASLELLESAPDAPAVGRESREIRARRLVRGACGD